MGFVNVPLALEYYHRRHFCNFLPPGFPSTYQFSKRLNPLDYDPTYPENPNNLAQYIRKYRKDKGLLIREFTDEIESTGSP